MAIRLAIATAILPMSYSSASLIYAYLLLVQPLEDLGRVARRGRVAQPLGQSQSASH
jgi:hypothetical protein